MSKIDSEKAILNEAPDFDHQIKILEEERKEIVKKRKLYILIIGILLFVVLIFIVSYSSVYFYKEFGGVIKNNCSNVNIKTNGSKVPNINITEGKDCVPVYNIDYYNNRKATFNVDIFGDRSYLFNKTNQKDELNKYCVLNCDSNADGWPDYNIDLNGDGKADVNIVINPQKKTSCDINCDINFDTLPDINIDLDGDNVADINITDGQSAVPKYNIDYKGNRKAVFNVKGENSIENPITKVEKGKKCDKNCDIDGDGWPDYNITIDSDQIINELIAEEKNEVKYTLGKDRDWKCHLNPNLNDCRSDVIVRANKYINIDVDGDGKADVNLSADGGKNIYNEIGKDVNIDYDKDGFPDYNIDVDGDGIADLNIIKQKTYKCIQNCDTNNDGKPDYLNKISEDLIVSIYNLNIDLDYDGVCDVNCDVTYDLIPDYGLDLDGDNIVDINIDYDGDGIVDFNIDTDGDFIPDSNLDAYGNGVCTFNCNNQNRVDNSSSCLRNCDTDNDGWPDQNVDIDGDYVCDFNCSNGKYKVDSNNDYYLDEEYNIGNLDLEENENGNFYVMNPIDIKSDNIEPGWSDKYLLKITNKTNHAVKYQIVWENVKNEYTDINNLDYNLSRNRTSYLNDMKAPRRDVILADNVIIAANSSSVFLLDISFKETGINQNIDSGKSFKGQLTIKVIN